VRLRSDGPHGTAGRRGRVKEISAYGDIRIRWEDDGLVSGWIQVSELDVEAFGEAAEEPAAVEQQAALDQQHEMAQRQPTEQTETGRQRVSGARRAREQGLEEITELSPSPSSARPPADAGGAGQGAGLDIYDDDSSEGRVPSGFRGSEVDKWFRLSKLAVKMGAPEEEIEVAREVRGGEIDALLRLIDVQKVMSFVPGCSPDIARDCLVVYPENVQDAVSKAAEMVVLDGEATTTLQRQMEALKAAAQSGAGAEHVIPLINCETGYGMLVEQMDRADAMRSQLEGELSAARSATARAETRAAECEERLKRGAASTCLSPQMLHPAAMQQNPQAMQMLQQIMRDPQAMQMLQQMTAGTGGGPFADMGMGAAAAQAADEELQQEVIRAHIRGQAAQPAQPGTPAPPRERFATQLQELSTMGFADEAANLTALQATDGSVDAALEARLL